VILYQGPCLLLQCPYYKPLLWFMITYPFLFLSCIHCGNVFLDSSNCDFFNTSNAFGHLTATAHTSSERFPTNTSAICGLKILTKCCQFELLYVHVPKFKKTIYQPYWCKMVSIVLHACMHHKTFGFMAAICIF